ncbi:hypothetical protein [Allostreptomyces psammosilenae]|uniref:WSC domain-containing protein n=1 Tax=Allostreptomyces psammosilenae TaxID=1892865 RepID=A0A852ZRN0_9ACTN|nr:hypothetical protein [Allostreptomyces psammosilenae]NYI04445.1 hypothetical protein [Allostreptomyces psammosilenae]
MNKTRAVTAALSMAAALAGLTNRSSGEDDYYVICDGKKYLRDRGFWGARFCVEKCTNDPKNAGKKCDCAGGGPFRPTFRRSRS